MHDLDVILDEVRANYYASQDLPRPTISWSHEYWTGFYGKYTLFDNQIKISRILNTDKISYEALASVVYHESLHQDFSDHNRKFNLRANKFPNYKNCEIELNKFAENVSATLEYSEIIADYAKGYKEITYITLPYSEDYINAFTFYNGEIYVDFNAKVPCSNDSFVVFLVDNGVKYHVVGWVSHMKVLDEKTVVKQEALGGYDFKFKGSAPRNNFRILFENTCTYGIGKENFPTEMKKKLFTILSSNSNDVTCDLQYINSYCEGFYDLGLDVGLAHIAAPYCLEKYSDLEKVAFSKTGFDGLWASNALCKTDTNFHSLYLKANSLRQIGMIEAAYKIMKQSYELSGGEDYILEEMIIDCAFNNDVQLGKKVVNELKIVNKDNSCLAHCIGLFK